MHLSWSQKIFLRLNKHLGESAGRDRFMSFLAHDLIAMMFGFFALWVGLLGIFFPRGAAGFVGFITLSFFFSYLMSYAIGLLWPHHRPIVELRRVKQLFRPFGAWKSFPSDHTIAVTIMTAAVVVARVPVWFFFIVCCASGAVALGRVYAGVHYPRDILGGIVIGVIGTFLAYSIVYPSYL